jgi:putative mRNA 3-end processing factor
MPKVSIRVLGSNLEVGRSAILVEMGGKRILMDYGMKLVPKKEPMYPEEVKDVDAVLLTHAHVDHSGSIPLPFNGKEVPIYGIDITRDFTELLLFDSLRVAKKRGYQLKYSAEQIKRALSAYRPVEYGVPFRIGEIRVTAYNAGHIPGSAMFRLEYNGFSLLYTGDFNLKKTRLMPSADTSFPKVDVLITESTYAFREHPPRSGQEMLLKNLVKNVISRGGMPIIAGFAIGRLAEVAMALRAAGVNEPVFLDGMAREGMRITQQYPERVRDFRELSRIFDTITFVGGWKMRRKLVKRSSIVLTTSGMLEGGPVRFYLGERAEDEKSAVVLTGYQIEGTDGRRLLEEGRINLEGSDMDVNMKVSQLNFSAHASRSDIFELINIASPDVVIPVHGEETERFSEEIRKRGTSSFVLKDPYEEMML